MNNKKPNKITVLLIVLLVLSLLGSWVFFLKDKIRPADPQPEPTVDVEPTIDPEIERLRGVWQENKQINEDYVGELIFDSGLISESFVQAKDVYKPNGEMYQFYTQGGSLVKDPSSYTGNDVYIWTYWKTGEYDYNNHGGSVFMDYRNDLDDENLIIYGHHFSVWNDEERIKAFTPLEKLLEAENYEENRFVTLVLENEIRKYVVAVVYEFDATPDSSHYDDCQYWRTEYNYDDYLGYYDENYYQNYINKITSIQLYSTGTRLTTSDKTLTLQTCISGHTGELFEILVLKQIEVIPFEG